jgi:hypothetical protein
MTSPSKTTYSVVDHEPDHSPQGRGGRGRSNLKVTYSKLTRMNLAELIECAKSLNVNRYKAGSGYYFDDFSKFTKAEIVEMICQVEANG